MKSARLLCLAFASFACFASLAVASMPIQAPTPPRPCSAPCMPRPCDGEFSPCKPRECGVLRPCPREPQRRPSAVAPACPPWGECTPRGDGVFHRFDDVARARLRPMPAPPVRG